MKLLFALLACCSLHAYLLNPLFPDLTFSKQIDLAIPADYVGEHYDPNHCVFAPQGDLDQYFGRPTSVAPTGKPIFFLQVVPVPEATKATLFGEAESIHLPYSNHKWGPFPVRVITASHSLKEVFLAYTDLGISDSLFQWTFFSLSPNMKEPLIEIWNDFLSDSSAD